MTQALRRHRDLVALSGVLLVGLALRLWSLDHGLPLVHNLDEASHFVTTAARMSWTDLNPRYFQNPPGFTYLLRLIFVFVPDTTTTLFIVGRAASAVLGVAAAALVFVAARRLYDQAIALAAAAFLSVAFLPVFYGHFALNDAPTLAPLCVALVGVAGVSTRGRRLDYVVAGVGLGAATATKYTAAGVALAIAVAWFIRVRDGAGLRPSMRDLAVAAAAALGAFVVLNPFSVLDADSFVAGVSRQQHYTAEIGKIGLDDTTGWQYYLWTLTWGFGVVPAALAAIGAVVAWRRNWRLIAPWLAFAVATWLFIGAQTRFYARWLLPVYPAFAVCAGLGVVAIARLVTGRWRPVFVAALLTVALAQPVVTIVHNNRVLGRTDTRGQAEDWLLRNVPRGQKLVVELVSSRGFLHEGSISSGAPYYELYPLPGGSQVENYSETLSPATLDAYDAQGYCVVLTGSTQRDRAFKGGVARAMAYYRALDAQAERLAVFSPVRRGAELPEFNFDMSYNWYPLVYERPGPRIDIYRLRTPGCAAS